MYTTHTRSAAFALILGMAMAGAVWARGAAPRQEQRAGDQVIIGFSSIPAHFDPLQGFKNGGQLLFSTLVEADAEMNIIPDLASEYAISEDALTYTFKIRKDARFTDGQPVKASDVVFTFTRLKQSAGGIDLSVMSECALAGEDTVVFTLSEPRSVFMLALAEAGIVPEHAYAGGGGARFGLEPVGSGPFKLVQFDAGQQFILEANADYYRTPPALKRAVFLNMNDEDTRFIAARSGRVDIALASAALASTASIPGYRLLRERSLDNMGIAMPMQADEGGRTPDGFPIGNNVTADTALRKALAYGIDRNQLCEDALSGFASPAYAENDGMPWWNPESVIETDAAYAVSVLEEAGWRDSDGDGIREKNGMRAEFTLLYFAGDSTRQAVALAAANQARSKLGIEIKVEGVAESDLLPRMFSTPLILAWGSSNPMTSYMLFHSSNAGRNDWYNPENFRSAIVDGYLDQALRASSLEASIPFWQKAQWDGATGTSLRGEAPYIFLINKDHLYWVREGLDTGRQKIHAHGDAWPLVANLKEWRWR